MISSCKSVSAEQLTYTAIRIQVGGTAHEPLCCLRMTGIVLDDSQNEYGLYTGGSIDQNTLTALDSRLKTLCSPQSLSQPDLNLE
jgi:hypothetical protein